MSRVLEQWDALILYFQAVSQQDHLLVSERINSMLQNLVLEALLSPPEFRCSQVHRPQYNVSMFNKCVQGFYIEAAMQIKKRFPLGDPTLKMLRVLDPQSSCSEFPSLVPLVSRFPNVVAEAEFQQLDSECRRLSLICLPFDKTDMGQEEFWGFSTKLKMGFHYCVGTCKPFLF